MNVSLPAELKRFVQKRVKDGVYESEADVIDDAVRQLQEKHSLFGDGRSLSASALSDFNDDIEALAFLVLMQATKSAREDLKMIMAEVKAITATKKKLRDLISKVNKDVAHNAGRRNGKRPLDFRSGMGSEKAYHRAQMPFADPPSKAGLKLVATDLFDDQIVDISQLTAIKEDLNDQLDSLSEMSELQMLRLQMVMDRQAKYMSTLSNLLKKVSSTQDSLVQNIK